MRVTGPPLPKEHGAYGQMAVPLVTALAVTGGRPAGLLFAVAVVAGFLLHEPLVVTLGGRGVRAREAAGASARWWALVWGGVVLVAGGAASFLLGDRWWLAAVPAAPALVVFDAAVRGTEKATLPQVGAAAGFAATAVPVLALGGAPANWLWLVPLVLGANSVLSTLAVRAVVADARRQADPAGVSPAKAGALGSAAVTLTLATFAWTRGLIGPWTFAAVWPGVLAAGVLAVRPPHARHLRTVGWTLAAGAVLTAGLLIVALLRV